MDLLEVIGSLNLALLDLIVVELLVTFIFIARVNKPVKFMLDVAIGKSKYRRTEVFIYVFVLLGMAWFFVSNLIQEQFTQWMAQTFQYSIIIVFFSLLSFTVFTVSRFMLEREWKHRLVKVPLILSVVLALIEVALFVLRSYGITIPYVLQ